MKTKTKALLITMCAALLVVATVFTTLAFLTDTKNVVNTFTVGDVQITLDEADVDEYCKILYEADSSTPLTRVPTNDYKLIPNHKYTKDPVIHTSADSEDSYVRMFVTLSQASAWDTALARYTTGEGGNKKPINTTEDIFTDTNADWEIVKTIEGDAEGGAGEGYRTYEFRYENKVAKSTNVPAPFESITVPKELQNDDLKNIDGTAHDFKIFVVAQAIQADGFENATAAFTAAPAITGSDLTP